MSFLVSGDIHLSELTFRSCPSVKWDSVRSFEILMYTAYHLNPYKILPVVLVGDIWDTSKITPELLARVLRVREKYQRVPLYYINGNHDSLKPSWVEFLGGTIHHLSHNPITLPDGEVVCGQDYLPPTKFKEVISDLKVNCDYFCCHQFIENQENLLIPQCVSLDVLRNFKIVLAGDIHKQHAVTNNTTTCLYTGSLNIRSLIETPSFLYITSKDNEDIPCKLENINFDWDNRLIFDKSVVLPIYPNVRDKIVKYFSEVCDKSLNDADINRVGVKDPAPWFFIIAPDFDAEFAEELKSRNDYHFILRKSKNPINEALETRGVYDATNIQEYTQQVINNLKIPEEIRSMLSSLISNDKEFFDGLPSIPSR